MYSPGLNAHVMMRCLMASYAASRSDATALAWASGSASERPRAAFTLSTRLDDIEGPRRLQERGEGIARVKHVLVIIASVGREEKWGSKPLATRSQLDYLEE